MENYKKAFESAQQEIQEKEVGELKRIIKNLLEKKQDKEKEKRELEKDINVIKQTIDDFKAGRLDKVKELIEKDDTARELLPFKIVIVNQFNYSQPWKWVYRVEPYQPHYYTTTIGNTTTFNTLGNSGVTLCSSTGTGQNFATFTSGTYTTGNNGTINL